MQSAGCFAVPSGTGSGGATDSLAAQQDADETERILKKAPGIPDPVSPALRQGIKNGRKQKREKRKEDSGTSDGNLSPFDACVEEE